MTNIPKNLTLEEVAEILLKKDTRTIESYISKGFLKSTTLNNVVTITAEELAQKLGVDDFNEPFIDEFEARTIANLTKHLTIKYCQEKVIPFFTLKHSNNQGDRVLFKRSLIEDWKSRQFYYIDIDTKYIEHIARQRALKILNQNFWVISDMLNLSKKQQDCIHMYLSGGSLESISNHVHLTRERVRQLIDDTVKRMNKFYKRISEVKEDIKNSSFKNTSIPWDIITQFEVLLSKSQKLEISYEKINKVINTLPDELKEKFFGYLEKEEVLNIEREILLKSNLKDYDFSVRTQNCFKAAEIFTIEELIKYDPEEFLKFRNFGKRSFTEIEEFMKEKGLTFIK